MFAVTKAKHERSFVALFAFFFFADLWFTKHILTFALAVIPTGKTH